MNNCDEYTVYIATAYMLSSYVYYPIYFSMHQYWYACTCECMH